MAFSELELKRIEQTVGIFCVKHSPAYLKDKLRLEYVVKGHDVVVVERRPRWDNRPSGPKRRWRSLSSFDRRTNGDCIGCGPI